MLLTY